MSPQPPSPDDDHLLEDLQSFAGSDAALLDGIDALLDELLRAAAARPEPVIDTAAIWARVEARLP
jgi:hypothetical protein